MLTSPLSPRAREIERQLSSVRTQSTQDSVQKFVRAKARDVLESQGRASSEYSVYAVRTNKMAGSEITGPLPIALGSYTEKALYGAASSPLSHFRLEMKALGRSARKLSQLDTGSAEYFYQSSLIWANVRRLTRFIGTTPSITELVNEFLLAHHQLRDREISMEAMVALASAFVLVGDASPLNDAVVDRVVDILESSGVDPQCLDLKSC